MPTATAAVVWETDAPFTLEQVVVDEPRDDEVLVEVVAAGMCHTDLSVRSGRTPFPLPGVLGHEGAGVVAAVGRSVRGIRPGDHVVLSYTSCGACRYCRTARPMLCAHWVDLNLLGGARLDGSSTITHDGEALHGHFFGQSSFASHAVVNERSVVVVDPDLPLETLAPLGCGVQTGAGAVLNVLRPEPGSTVAVFGAGGVGLSAVLATRLTAAGRVIVVDVQRERLDLAASLGATDVVDPADGGVVEQLLELTDGLGVDGVLETTGAPSVLRQAVDVAAHDATIGVIGAPPLGTEVAFDVPAMLVAGPRIVGVNQGRSIPQQTIPALIAAWAADRFPFDTTSGRALLEAIRTGVLPPPPAATLLQLDLDVVDEGEVTFGFHAVDDYGNPMQVHGGILAAVADFATTCAVWTLLPAESDIVTADLHVTYLRPVPLDGARYQCHGVVVHLGRSQANATATIVAESGTTHVLASATCRIRRPTP